MDVPEIANIVHNLVETEPTISKVVISTKDGQPIFALKRNKSEFGEQLFIIPVAIISAFAMSSALMNSMDDEVGEYIVFQEKSIIISIKTNEIVLTVYIDLPKSSFERRVEVKQYIAQFREYAEKINAIMQTIAIEGSLIEKVKRRIPESSIILLLSSAGIPIDSLQETFDLDDAQIAAISSGIILPTKTLSDGITECIAVKAKKYLLLLFPLENDQILFVALPPKHSIETYMTKIAKIIRK